MFRPHLLFSLMLSIIWQVVHAQSYVDPIQMRYTYGLRNNSEAAAPFTHLWVGSDLPIKLRHKTYQLFSPYYEQWDIDSAEKTHIVPQVKGLVFPVGVILPMKDTLWTINLLPMIRWNGEEIFADKTFQIGGAAFITRQIKPGKMLRFGVYMNTEFFGFFVMPLVGADWRIDNKNYVFGLLPGRLTWEHKVKNKLYYGATFRALTNSFRQKDGQFLRIDDNQISMYMDYYIAKRFCLTVEPGYGIMRKLRTGKETRTYTQNINWGDGPFIKLSTSYRIRLYD